MDTKKEIKCLKTSPQQVNGLNYRGSVDPKSDPLLLDYLIKCFFLFKKRFLSTDELLSSYKQTWILHPSKGSKVVGLFRRGII